MSDSTLRIAWRNLGRNRRRTALAIAAIGLGQFTLVFVNCMMAGMYEDMLDTITGPLMGHVQIHHPDWRSERAIDLAVPDLAAVSKALAAIDEVESLSPRLYAPVLVVPGAKGTAPALAETGMIVGIDISAESQEGGIIDMLSPDQLPGKGRVAVGKVLARRLGIAAGDSIAIIGQDADEFPTSDLFEVTAVIRSMTDLVNRMGIVMAFEDAGPFLALDDDAHEIIVHGRVARDAPALAEQIRSLPEMQKHEVLDWREAAPELVSMIEMKDWMDLIFVAILFVAAAAGIANTMVMSTFERTREFGMLLAVGSRPMRIVRMVVLEAIILGLIGVAVGSALGSAMVIWTSHTGIDYAALTNLRGQEVEVAFQGLNISYVIFPTFEWRHITFGIVAVTLTSVLAALWPSILAARQEPAEAMRS
jgi:putative ABC transport system permease protein